MESKRVERQISAAVSGEVEVLYLVHILKKRNLFFFLVYFVVQFIIGHQTWGPALFFFLLFPKLRSTRPSISELAEFTILWTYHFLVSHVRLYFHEAISPAMYLQRKKVINWILLFLVSDTQVFLVTSQRVLRTHYKVTR